jgi:hypothetical protein
MSLNTALRAILTAGLLGASALTSGCEDVVTLLAPAPAPTYAAPVPAFARLDAVATILPITPVVQQQSMWCWAASLEMIFRYYGAPPLSAGGYQCGLAALRAGPTSPCFADCRLCGNLGGGTLFDIATMLMQYGTVARQLGVSSPNLTASPVARSLTAAEVLSEVRRGRPVVVGINSVAPGIAMHAAVLVGAALLDGVTYVYINDPWPYSNAGTANPYLPAGGRERQPGQYVLSLDALTSSVRVANAVVGISVNK